MEFAFFWYLFIQCQKQLLQRVKSKVDEQIIFAAVCGYLILGIIATVLFSFSYQNIEGAFNIVDPKETDFLYFSFISMTAVGYGDITPTSPFTKSLAVAFGIIGQLYLTILVAILVGQYVSNNNT